MPDGVGSGEHQPTVDEQTVIDAQMPEGSDRAKASDDREQWHLSAELNNPAAVNDICALEFNRIPDSKSGIIVKVFVGEVQGHHIQIQQNTEESGVVRYMGSVDGKSLNQFPGDQSGAEKMYNQLTQIREGTNADSRNIEKIKQDDGKKETAEALADIFGSKK